LAGKTGKALSRAFTLTELLVVLAIICLLAALLMPVLAAAKRDGYRASSVSGLRQTFVASSLYSADYDDRVPYAVSDCDWRDLCHAQTDDRLWQFIQANHIPSFSQALQPYGFDRRLFLIQAGRGPEVFARDGTSYGYSLILSSAQVSDLAASGCYYFVERYPNFWNGGVFERVDMRFLSLFFSGQVAFPLYRDELNLGGACHEFTTDYISAS